MYVRCCACKDIRGEKKPFSNKQTSDGYCLPCFKAQAIMAHVKPSLIEETSDKLQKLENEAIRKGDLILFDRNKLRKKQMHLISV